MNSIRNRVAEEDGGVVSVTVGAGAVDMAAVTAVATAVAISADVGGGGLTGVAAGAGTGVPTVGAPGVAVAAKPVEESVVSFPHSM